MPTLGQDPAHKNASPSPVLDKEGPFHYQGATNIPLFDNMPAEITWRACLRFFGAALAVCLAMAGPVVFVLALGVTL